MEWKPIPIVSADDQPAQGAGAFCHQHVLCGEEGAKNPEAAVKLLNFDFEKLWGETAEPDVYSVDNNMDMLFEYALLYGEAPRKNLDAHLNVVKALDAKDPSALNTEEKGYYDNILAYRGRQQVVGQ